MNLGSIRLDALSDWCIQTCPFSQCWEKIDFSLLVFDLVVSSVFASNSSWSHIFSLLWSPKTTLGQNQFNFYVNEKRIKKKNEFNGDVAWFLKRMESAWCKRTIMEELFFFNEKLGRSCMPNDKWIPWL